MATGTLRIILVAAALVIGAVVVANAFPGDAAPVSVDEPVTGDEPAEQPDTGGGQGTQQGAAELTPPAQIRVQVLNATDEQGLAEDTAAFVESLGYTDVAYGDADDDTDVSTIAYRPEFREEAKQLRKDLFQDAVMQRATADSDYDITVVIGFDYVNKGGG